MPTSSIARKFFRGSKSGLNKSNSILVDITQLPYYQWNTRQQYKFITFISDDNLIFAGQPTQILHSSYARHYKTLCNITYLFTMTNRTCNLRYLANITYTH